jgi:hypothetical protein
MKDKKAIAEIKRHVDNLSKMLVDPQTGLLSWASMFGVEMEWLTTYWRKGIETAIAVTKSPAAPKKKTLEELLQDISVVDPGQWENNAGPRGWFAVTDDSGIIAYFGSEDAALFFRLALINARLNPM